MAKVIAITKGYFGGIVREIGDVFDITDDLWRDEKRRPSWVKLDPKHAFGGKGDHDGDGNVGGSKTAGHDGDDGDGETVTVPLDWQNLGVGEARKLASQIAGREVKKAKEAHEIIAAHVEANKAETFGDAPAPQELAHGNGVIEALGKQPDWVAPGHIIPAQVDD